MLVPTVPVGARVRVWSIVGEGFGDEIKIPGTDETVKTGAVFMAEGIVERTHESVSKSYIIQLDNGQRVEFRNNLCYCLSEKK